MPKQTKITPKKAKRKKPRAKKGASIRKRKAVKPTAEDSFFGRIKNAFDGTAGKIKMFLPAPK